MKEAVKKLLEEMGENPTREGLAKTPDRVAAALKQLTSGYAQELEEIVNGAVFAEKNRDMVVVRDIEFYSLCEHHLLPFFGKVHVGYIPNGKILGLSKIPRVVDMYARRLQVQERMTREIAEAIQKAVQPLGVGVVVEAHHFCMMMRGVEKQNSATVSSSMLGAFREKPATRAEFLVLARQQGAGERD